MRSSEAAAARNPPRGDLGPVSGATCEAAPNRLCPTDDGTNDPSFAAFRNAFREAVRRRDKAKLVAMIDPKIRTSFGGKNGVAELDGQLANADSAVWPELEALLRLGGAFQGVGNDRSFWAPYVYARWPESIDPFSHAAATAASVIVRAEPNATASQIALVSWEILELVPNPSGEPQGPWRHVRTSKGEEGWVQEGDIRSSLDYRAAFSKRTGDWKMDTFVKGD